MTAKPERDLVVVVPVYNEQACIRKVLAEWSFEIENWTTNFEIIVINDGSSDGSRELVEALVPQHQGKLTLVSRENRGHGRSCIEGYLLAAERGAEWILQIDSDGQCDPSYFFKFWNQRHKYDVIFGHRKRREDGLRRVLASIALKWFLAATQGVFCIDANVPYRLMNAAACASSPARASQYRASASAIASHLSISARRLSTCAGVFTSPCPCSGS